MQTFRRLGSQAKAGRSHYQYKNWTWDESGKRQAPISVRPLRGEYADLINTCYYNPSKGTNTLYCLALDLDAHRARPEWKTKKGKLKWHRIKKFIRETHPDIFKFIFAAVTSTGGHGLALYLAVRPLELSEKTRKAQFSAKTLLEKLLILFNQHGLGADPSAIGLKRDFCNWLNLEKSVYDNQFVLKSVQSDKTPVVRHLLAYLKPFALAEYVRKSERAGLLYPDLRAERKLAKLYTHLHDLWLDHQTTVSMSVAELRKLTSLSRPFVEKFLKKPPEWLLTEYQGRSEGWALTVKLSQDLLHRSRVLLTEGPCAESQDFAKPLIRAEKVSDGQRNHWITYASLLLKHSGIRESQATEIIEKHISKISGHEESKNCKAFKSIIRNIYLRYKNLFAVRPGCAPDWLLNPCHLERKQRQNEEISTTYKRPFKNLGVRKADSDHFQMQTILKKGGKPPAAILRKISRDQCFIFEKNYYSLPRSYTGRQVLAFPWEGRLRVYDAITKKHIHTHKIIDHGKGKYQADPDHIGPFGESERKYFEHLVKQFQRDGPHIGDFAQSLVNRHQHFSLRRLWILRGMVNEYGCKLVNYSAIRSRSIRDLCASLKCLKEVRCC